MAVRALPGLPHTVQGDCHFAAMVMPSPRLRLRSIQRQTVDLSTRFHPPKIACVDRGQGTRIGALPSPRGRQTHKRPS
jgi:hypothetical protein